MNEKFLIGYADIILKTGVNIQKGQSVYIRIDPVSRDFGRLLMRRAYELGAKYVFIEYEDDIQKRIRVDSSEKQYLEYFPMFYKFTRKQLIDENWVSISVRGNEDPDFMSGADPARLGIMNKASSNASKEFLSAISANKIAWNVCLFPTRAWAAKVLGKDFPKWEKKIWNILTPILRLDSDDPAQTWIEHDLEIKRRAAFLNEKSFDRIRFEGPGTDLVIGMCENRSFVGARGKTVRGIPFFANLPTEEVFSTPDFRRTLGKVRCTRPVTVMGTQVEGAWFRFEEGAVVEFGADKNESILGKYLEIDEQSRYLGEIALVGIDSPIYRSGLIFHNILFDENASSHIALGNGYTDCIRGAFDKSDIQLMEMGCNVSLVHTDFMIGSHEVSVYGVHKDGTEEAIIREGKFII